jgi:glycosyltransferase involved in cell wall biosynthesis
VYARTIVTVENPLLAASGRQRRLGQLRSLFHPDSYERRTHLLPRFQAELDRLAEDWQPDAIIIEFAQMGYFRFPTGIPLILDAHNVEHEILARMAAGGGPLRRLYSARNGAKLRRDEAELLRRVDAVAVTSERDRQILGRLAPDTRLTVAPNGVDTGYFAPVEEDAQAAEVLFFGAMDYSPNSDAVLRFQRAVWPRLRARRPDLRFAVVGREPPRALRELHGPEGIEIVGPVDDLRPWIAGAAVVVAPLRAGSGTRLKVLEALAMARPVVSTSVGVEGLEVEDGHHLLIADDPQGFAGAVERVLADRELAERLGAEGRRLVEERYDWRVIAGVFEQIIVDAVQRRD